MSTADADLVREILAGDAEAYAVLVKRYQRPIFNLMLRMTYSDEDARDLTQDTFIRAYEKLEQFKASRSFFPWLYTIGMNLARDFQRKAKVSRNAQEALIREQDPLPVSGGNPHGDVEAKKVGRLLEKLPEDYREALMLRFHEGLSMNELSDALGISVSGAKMRVSRGLAQLREWFGSKADEERIRG